MYSEPIEITKTIVQIVLKCNFNENQNKRFQF